jgi:hypothetical protein
MPDTETIFTNPEQFEVQAPEIIDISNVTNKTIFLQVRYGSVGNTRKVSGSTVLTTEADMGLLRVSKTLEAIRHHDTQLRKYLGNMCLPYSQLAGVLMLPYALIKPVKDRLKTHTDERKVLVETFVEAYPSLKVKAKEQLKDLYVEDEYPSIDELREKFRFEWSMLSFSTPKHLQSIDPELYESELQKERESIKIATEEITAVMRGTLLEMVQHLQERLTPGPDGKAKIIRESAVAKMNEFLDTFENRNVTDDKELATEVQKVRSLLGGTTAQALRTSEEWKEKIRNGMQNVSESLGKLVKEKPGRRFKNV